MDRKAKGKYGEDLAEKYLVERGVEILERNYRQGRAEIDLIGLINNNLLVFYEIKLRKNDAFGTPESFVSSDQQERIVSTADHYIHAINWKGDIRFDVVSINQKSGELELIEDAFY